MSCIVIENGEQCLTEPWRSKMCRKHYERYLRWGTPVALGVRSQVARPRCPECNGTMTERRSGTVAYGSVVARQRSCNRCLKQVVTLEVPMKPGTAERMAQILLGRYLDEMLDSAASPVPSEDGASVESTGTTTSGASV